jgi:hypothetical protein
VEGRTERGGEKRMRGERETSASSMVIVEFHSELKNMENSTYGVVGCGGQMVK